VLFCDLVGFTSASEEQDPEVMREIQTLYFSRMRQELARYGGTVEKYAGDAVLAFFGVPTTHEDDPERAVLCALSMQAAMKELSREIAQRWGIVTGARIGVNTGDVVSGMWDTGARRDWGVTGDTVNTASRLQTAANPGEVLVGEETMRLARRQIAFGEQRHLVLKGKAEPVRAFRALEPLQRTAERWETSKQRTPLVGRQADLQRILTVWAEAGHGKGQIVTLTADAGVGKSRLLAEAVERIVAESEVRELRGRCFSYGQGITLSLVADFVRALSGIYEGEGPEQAGQRLSQIVDSLLDGASEATRLELLDVLRDVLGLPVDSAREQSAQVRRQTLVRGLRLILEGACRETPAVLILEDLHWIDVASADVLADVLTVTSELPMLILSSQRPGTVLPWHSWSWTETMIINPFDHRDAVMMAQAVLGESHLSPELQASIAERTGGNPFFVEELLFALRETGGLVERDGEIGLLPGAVGSVPPTLTEVLLARLDRLEVDIRGLAQVASVIGRTFAVRLLAHVLERDMTEVERSLAVLEGAGIAYPRAGSEGEYAFKHALMRDVAYKTLVARRRRQLHTSVARAIAAQYPSDESAEMIAYHFALTDEHVEAAEWLERAGDRATGMYANGAALEHYDAAHERLQRSGAGTLARARVQEKRSAVLKTLARYDEAIDALEGVLAVYQDAGDLEAQRRVLAELGRVHAERGTTEEGVSRIVPVVAELDQEGPTQALAELEVALAHLLYRCGRYPESLASVRRGLEIARTLGNERLQAEAEYRQGWVLHLVGQEAEGRPLVEGAAARARAIGDLDTLQMALYTLGVVHWKDGALRDARSYFEQARDTVERLGNPAKVALQLAWIGYCSFYLGDWPRGRAEVEQALAIPDFPHSAYYYPLAVHFLGRIELAEGHLDAARSRSEEALRIAEPEQNMDVLPSASAVLVEALRLSGLREGLLERLAPYASTRNLSVTFMLPVMARLYLEAGNMERADAVLTAAAPVTKTLSRLAHVDILLAQAELFLTQERFDEAEGALNEALSLAWEMEFPYGEAGALSQSASLLARQGNAEQAGIRYQAAIDIFRRLGAVLDVRRLEEEIAPQIFHSPRG
jgi:adenylate cyclase